MCIDAFTCAFFCVSNVTVCPGSSADRRNVIDLFHASDGLHSDKRRHTKKCSKFLESLPKS